MARVGKRNEILICHTYLGKFLKSIVNYSINVKVLEEFNREVKDQTRSRLVEALLIEWLVKHTREIALPSAMVKASDVPTKEII